MDHISRRGLARIGAGAIAASALAGCSASDPLTQDLPPMGRFRLVAPIVVTKGVKRVPPSRPATPEAWEAVVMEELARRFGAYDGGTDYYVALNVDGYALAPPGIPVVLTPKSLLVVTANLWTADPQEKVLGPQQIVTFEGAETLLLGSGYTKDADAQMRTLARNMAVKVQRWILESPEVVGLPGRGGGLALAGRRD